MLSICLTLKRLRDDSSGQDMVEYALLVGFLAVAVGAAFPNVATPISTLFSRLASVASQAAA